MADEKATGDGDEGDPQEKDLPKVIEWMEDEALSKAHQAKKCGARWQKCFDSSLKLSPMEERLIEARLEHFVETPHPSSDEVFKNNREAFLVKYRKDPAYLPPSDRLLLNRDISYDSRKKRAQEGYEIAMFCDLQNSRKEKINPRGFQYVNESSASPRVRPPDLKYMKYSCACVGPCSIETCKCMEINHLANRYRIEMQNGRVSVDDPRCDASSYALFLCGPECGCPANCPNRVENVTTRNKFELFRRDPVLGFGVRSLTNISFGEIVGEFVGEICEDSSTSTDSNTWIMELATRHDDLRVFMDPLRDLLEVDLPEEAWKRAQPKGEFSILLDCSKKGNFSRFLSHGCHPNLQILRVIANFVAVPFHRLFVYATRAIPAGAELFIDYGRNFSAQLDCRCGTPLCEKEELLKFFSRPQLLALLKELHINWLEVAKAKEARMGRGREESSRSPEVITIDDSDDVEQRPHLEYDGSEDPLHSTDGNVSDDSIHVQRQIPEKKEPIACITLDDSDEEEPHQPNKIESSENNEKVSIKEEGSTKDPSATYWPPGQHEPPMGWAKFCAMKKKKLKPPPLLKSRKLREATAPLPSPEGHLQKTTSTGEVGARLAAGGESEPSVGIEARPRSQAQPSDVLPSEAKPSSTPIGLNEGISAGGTETEATIFIKKETTPIVNQEPSPQLIKNSEIYGSRPKKDAAFAAEMETNDLSPAEPVHTEEPAPQKAISRGDDGATSGFKATPSSSEAGSLDSMLTGDDKVPLIRAKAPNDVSRPGRVHIEKPASQKALTNEVPNDLSRSGPVRTEEPAPQKAMSIREDEASSSGGGPQATAASATPAVPKDASATGGKVKLVYKFKGVMQPPPLVKPRRLREAALSTLANEAPPSFKPQPAPSEDLEKEETKAPRDSSTSQAVLAEENASPSNSPPSKKGKTSLRRGLKSARKSSSRDETVDSQSHEEAPNTTAHVVLIDLTVEEDEASPPDDA